MVNQKKIKIKKNYNNTDVFFHGASSGGTSRDVTELLKQMSFRVT